MTDDRSTVDTPIQALKHESLDGFELETIQRDGPPPMSDRARVRQIDVSLPVADRYKLAQKLGEGGMATVYVGGRYSPILHDSKLRPYVSMSLGMSRFVASPGDEEAGFSVGFGGGTDLPLSPRVALRFDARLFTTIALSSGQIYCEPQQCTSFATGSTFIQFAGSVGLVFK
ncbi:MAG: hypothetical protein ACSLFQ_15460 [Thermoanaerobaculia bacterium]